MGAKSGFALKFLQWFIRGVQFCCSALILGVYSYFLAALANHNLRTTTSIRAVEGIAGVGVLYTIAALLLLCCLAGFAFTSFVAIVLDVAFIGAFIYVAVANKHGASSCNGYVDTPFGSGQSQAVVNSSDGFTALPSFHTACRLQTACLAVAIIAIFFFIFSILVELALVRHHRKEKRFGPGPANNYTSGYSGRHTGGGGGALGRIFRRGTTASHKNNDNTLPEHTHPEMLHHDNRQSYGTERTAVNPQEGTYSHPNPAPDMKHELSGQPVGGYGGFGPGGAAAGAHGNTRYNDGVYDRV